MKSLKRNAATVKTAFLYDLYIFIILFQGNNGNMPDYIITNISCTFCHQLYGIAIRKTFPSAACICEYCRIRIIRYILTGYVPGDQVSQFSLSGTDPGYIPSLPHHPGSDRTGWR